MICLHRKLIPCLHIKKKGECPQCRYAWCKTDAPRLNSHKEMSWFWAFQFFFWVIVIGPLERLPMYLSHRGSSPNVVRKKLFEKLFLFLKILKCRFFFLVIGTRPLKRLPTYLSHKGSGPNVVWKKKVLKNLLFWNEVSFWVIVTGPLKRLPTYLSHRGSSPNVVWKKVLKFLLKNKYLKWVSFFFFFGKKQFS